MRRSPTHLSSRFWVNLVSSRALLVGLGLVIGLADAPLRAAVFDSFDPVRHNRFLVGGDPNPAFFLASDFGVSLDELTGVGLNRAVLITPQHYVTADHAPTDAPMFRGSDGVVRTYATNSSLRLTTTLPDTSMALSDITIYRLTDPIPMAHGVQPLPIVSGNPNDLVGHTMFVIGESNQAGRNTIEESVIVSFAGDTSPTLNVRYSFDTLTNGGTGGLGGDEAGLISGDSGFQALIQLNGQLAVIGTHMGIDVSGGQDPLNGDLYNSFSTVLTPYLDEINAFTGQDNFQATTLVVTAVPEPSSMPWIGGAIVILSGLLRRGQKARRQLNE